MHKFIILFIFFSFILAHGYTQKMPDLIVEKIETPQWKSYESKSSASDSSLCLVYITIKNQGAILSKPVILKVWDMSYDRKDKEPNICFEIKKKIPALNKNQSIRVLVTFKYWVYNPNCELGVFIDYNNTVNEENEENNTFVFFDPG